MFLRVAHTQNFNLDNQNLNPDLLGRLLFFLIPYGVLVLTSILYFSKSVSAQMNYPVYPLPSEKMQKIIYFIVLLLIGVVGGYAAYDDNWIAYAWILYAVANVLLALYLFLYQTGKRITLFVTAIVSILISVVIQWLFIETYDMTSNFNDVLIRNFVGAIEAWAIVYCMITLGQVMVHEIGLNKKCQVYFFFIFSIILLIALAFWNRKTYAQW